MLAAALTAPIESVLPKTVRAACVPVPPGSGSQAQHDAGRAAARLALARLGVTTAQPLPRLSSGAPLWPSGTVGSISHTDSMALALSAMASDFGGVGVDIETESPLGRDVLAVVAPSPQLTHIDDLARTDAPLAALNLIVFCAKEAVFKAIAPHSPAPPQLREIEIRLRPASPTQGTFTGSARLRPAALGSYRLAAGHVVAVAWW